MTYLPTYVTIVTVVTVVIVATVVAVLTTNSVTVCLSYFFFFLKNCDNSKTPIWTKLKNSNCDQTQKLKL